MPTQITSGSFGSTATEPVGCVPAFSKMLVHESPSFPLFHTPPAAVEM
ncbi:MAG: hypothetical protein HC882_06650 [Acidobacteria bacterium]|nr:hypothetical protein [Acidobacteriota bacterium]